MNAAQMRSYHLEVSSDICIVEVIHFVHHTYGRVDDGESTECTRSFAQSESQLQQGLCLQIVEHGLVSTLIALVGKHHVVFGVWIEMAGS